ncbi:RNA-dependent RNA polymerase [Fusarium poae dsRNA virus 3]|uniref:RNA-directed RNA polymerase n=1 Tax=Fusarium poae dsRNA virus 3 TaxID=1848169 RepID=A0A2Z1Q3S4_9VIRU|nr:RNA-dependent RNA polymerase [Fusarium poae dsRNA virus 3]ANE10467.1 RNA-dependent RNA polymerase [Fusarium poae dsRNA virus 3]
MTDDNFTGSYKLSGKEYLGYDFSKIHSLYKLDRPPTTLASAAVARVMLHPQPDALNLAIPPIHQLSNPLALSPPNVVALGHAWLRNLTLATRITRRKKERLLSSITFGEFKSYEVNSRIGQYTYFPNYSGNLETSCATTLMSLLGNFYPITDTNDLLIKHTPSSTERPQDPYKLGLPYPSFMAYICATVRPGIRVILEADAFEGPLERDHFDAVIDPSVKVLIVIHGSSHVSYYVNSTLLNDELELYRDYAYFNASSFPAATGFSIKQLLPKLDEAYPPNRGRPGGKIHVSLQDIVKNMTLGTGQYALLERAWRYRDANDWEAVIVTTLLLIPYLESYAGVELTLFFLRSASVFFTLPFAEAVKALKEVHNFIRQFSTIPGCGIPSLRITDARAYSDLLYGLDTIPGRSELLNLDFDGELIMRAADPTIRAVPTIDRSGNLFFDYEKYSSYETAAARETFDSILPNRISVESFSSWYDRRMFWAASGGAPGAKVTWTHSSDPQDSSDHEGNSREEKLRINKRGALLAIPEKHFMKVLTNAVDPIQWSVKALKYEPGKLRSILNTSMESYLFQGYLLDIFDNNVLPNTWYASSNSGLPKIMGHVRRLKALKNQVGCMWDYADFNINHTFEGMRLLYETLTAALLKRIDWKNTPGDTQEAYNDIKRISSWVVRARLSTYVQDNDTGNIMKLARSLQSGERGTSFTNTLRSNIDHGIVNRAAAALFGRPLTHTQGDKTGDDVFLLTRTMRDAVLLCALFNLCGFAGQVYKVLVSYPQLGGARGEFVRYGYDASSGAVRGYPIRALSGFVHGEFFHDPIHSPAERGAAILEQYAKLTRRGIHLPRGILESYLARATQLVYTQEGVKHRVNVPLDLILTPAALGGVGISYNPSGLLSSVGSSISELQPIKAAILIPSGEGKTTLAQSHPEYFVDHDQLISLTDLAILKADAVATGHWQKVNAYLRSVSPPPGKVLLTWSPETVPHDSLVIGAFMLTKPSGLRANAANRKSLMLAVQKGSLSRKVFKLCPNHGVLVKNALHCLSAYAVQGGVVRTSFVNEDNVVKPLPRLQLPSLGAHKILRRSKTKVVDYQTMAKFGVESKIPDLDESLLSSGLTAALPARTVSDAIARQAKALDVHLAGLRKVYVKTTLPIELHSTELVTLMRKLLHSLIHGAPNSAGDSNLKPYAPVLHPTHHYGATPSLIRPLGFSNGKALALTIDGQRANLTAVPGRLGKLLTLLKRASRLVRKGDGNAASTVLRFEGFLRSTLAVIGTNSESISNLMAYVEGTFNLYPPQNMTVPAELVSLERDLALSYFEMHYLNTLTLDPPLIRELISVLDTAAHLAVVQTLQEEFPGFLIRD